MSATGHAAVRPEGEHRLRGTRVAHGQQRGAVRWAAPLSCVVENLTAVWSYAGIVSVNGLSGTFCRRDR